MTKKVQHEHNTNGRTETIEVMENGELVTYVVYYCTCSARVVADRK